MNSLLNPDQEALGETEQVLDPKCVFLLYSPIFALVPPFLLISVHPSLTEQVWAAG